MLTRREIAIAAVVAVCVAFGFTVMAARSGAPPLMNSSAFDWSKIEAKPTKIGEVRQFFKQPTATLDELSLHVTTLNPGQSPHPPHQHPEEEVLVVKEGTVEAYLSDGTTSRTQKLGPGSVIFQASNQMHTIKNVGQTPATYHVIQWKAKGEGRK